MLHTALWYQLEGSMKGQKGKSGQEGSGAIWMHQKQQSGSFSLWYSKTNTMPVYPHLYTQSTVWDEVQEL